MPPSAGNFPGLWIAVFGPDGAGKSAVIERLQTQLGNVFRGVARFHFRPMFRPYALEKPPVADPHAKPQRGRLISLCKLIYWLLDCWFGYLVAIRPALFRSRLVVFDRYFPDILVDPHRYRVPTSALWLARRLLPLIPQPDLCILLDVPAEVVQQRKREVSLSESQRQRVAYLALFEALPASVAINADQPLDEVTQQVASRIFEFLADRAAEAQKPAPVAVL